MTHLNYDGKKIGTVPPLWHQAAVLSYRLYLGRQHIGENMGLFLSVILQKSARRKKHCEWRGFRCDIRSSWLLDTIWESSEITFIGSICSYSIAKFSFYFLFILGRRKRRSRRWSILTAFNQFVQFLQLSCSISRFHFYVATKSH
jgi:hypothetical protein